MFVYCTQDMTASLCRKCSVGMWQLQWTEGYNCKSFIEYIYKLYLVRIYAIHDVGDFGRLKYYDYFYKITHDKLIWLWLRVIQSLVFEYIFNQIDRCTRRLVILWCSSRICMLPRWWELTNKGACILHEGQQTWTSYSWCNRGRWSTNNMSFVCVCE